MRCIRESDFKSRARRDHSRPLRLRRFVAAPAERSRAMADPAARHLIESEL
jgi:hypothetical protein